MARGSALKRTLQFFREEDIDVARVAFTLVGEIVSSRLEKAVKDHGRQVAIASTPRKSRSRKPVAAPAPEVVGALRQETLDNAAQAAVVQS